MCSKFLFRFRQLEKEEAFDIACCDGKVQELILPQDFKYSFQKVDEVEGSINFFVEKYFEDDKRRKKEAKKQKEKKQKKHKTE